MKATATAIGKSLQKKNSVKILCENSSISEIRYFILAPNANE